MNLADFGKAIGEQVLGSEEWQEWKQWSGQVWQHIASNPSYTLSVGSTAGDLPPYGTYWINNYVCPYCQTWVPAGVAHVCPKLVTGWNCAYCGAFVKDGETHFCPNLDPLAPAGNQVRQWPEPIPLHEYTEHQPDLARGWICPRCGKVWGPLIANCDCEPEQKEA